MSVLCEYIFIYEKYGWEFMNTNNYVDADDDDVEDKFKYMILHAIIMLTKQFQF